MNDFKYDEMKYEWMGESKVLIDAKYKGYRFFILSIGGNHPCAYVEIPENHPLFEKDYNDSAFDDMSVHGGVTYTESFLKIPNICHSWFIGWDYAHIGDYVALPIEMEQDDHKWTVKEIIEQDIIPAIDWLERRLYEQTKKE